MATNSQSVVSDPDANAYILAVEAADGQILETAVRTAINNFVVGCKADGIWTAIKASCILAGARTLAGALVPLVGTAPTNNNFVTADYNRKTGLIGNASTKYLDSKRSYTDDPQDDFHLSVYISSIASSGFYIGGQGSSSACNNDIYRSTGTNIRIRGDANVFSSSVAGFTGGSRNNATNFIRRIGSASSTNTVTSNGLTNSQNVFVFARNLNGTINLPGDGRQAFYSIGRSLDLALMDTRVTTLINAIAAAIP